MTSIVTARRLNDLAERRKEIDLRMQCAFAAGLFWPRLPAGVSIASASQYVYDWVTKVEGE